MASRAAAAAAVAVLALALLASGCGGGDETAAPTTDTAAETTTDTTAATSDRAKFPDLKPAGPAKPGTSSTIANYRPGSYQSMSQFLTVALNRVDAYWTRIFRNSGIREPFVNYNWLAPGSSVQPNCLGGPTNDESAMYCPGDDTIYISRVVARNFWEGFLGSKRAKVYPGAFGLAYVVAHEYGHNIQTELGIYSTRPTVKLHELQADCLAGVFANSEYYAGVLDAGDVQRAISKADFLGDYNYNNAGHHGTPAERVTAWKLGYNTGSPDRCRNTYLP